MLVGCVDADAARAQTLARERGAASLRRLAALLELAPDVVVVSTTHDALAPLACEALAGGAHVLVEKPAGRNVADVDRIAARRRGGGAPRQGGLQSPLPPRDRPRRRGGPLGRPWRR